MTILVGPLSSRVGIAAVAARRYTLSLHDALPIFEIADQRARARHERTRTVGAERHRPRRIRSRALNLGVGHGRRAVRRLADQNGRATRRTPVTSRPRIPASVSRQNGAAGMHIIVG